MGFDMTADSEALAALEFELRASRESLNEEAHAPEVEVSKPLSDLEALAALKSELLAADAEAQAQAQAESVHPRAQVIPIPEIAATVGEADETAQAAEQAVEETPIFAHTAIPSGDHVEGISS
jgi:hypothetical protein